MGTTTRVINEGVVADLAACAALCTTNISMCKGYQFTATTAICKTFTETYELQGDNVAGTTCVFRQLDIAQTFT